MKNHIRIALTVVLSCLFIITANAQLKTKIFNDGVPASMKPIGKKITKIQKVSAPVGFIELKQKNKELARHTGNKI
jgi:hypothetical protein